jgi:bifunctional NMN adenylyltransferase/nudix hydrolase
MNPKIIHAEVGVIIARFQTTKLTEAHIELIESVRSRHKKVLILLGSAPTKATRNNPLDFYTRRLMVNKAYPDITVLPVKDMATDIAWSKGVDSQIRSVFDIESIVIYGSRDSFIPHYFGGFKTIELEAAAPNISGTETRKLASEEARATEDFRAGAIYSAYNRYPTVYSTIDVAIFAEKRTKILLGKRRTEKKDKWRFIGGFVDPNDNSKETTVRREVSEEAPGIEVSTPEYIGSIRVNDWRYEKEVDKIMTTMYAVDIIFGKPDAGDDIDDVKFFDYNKLTENDIVEEHIPLFRMLKEKVK